MKIQLSDHFTCSKLLRLTLPSIVDRKSVV